MSFLIGLLIGIISTAVFALLIFVPIVERYEAEITAYEIIENIKQLKKEDDENEETSTF